MDLGPAGGRAARAVGKQGRVEAYQERKGQQECWSGSLQMARRRSLLWVQEAC